jgi:homocysteine S-methyltransferase
MVLQWVTDGGLETELLFHRRMDLPEFAAFPLVEQSKGARVLADYYRGYVAVAVAAGAGLVLETPTWRANADWGRSSGTTVPHSTASTARPSTWCGQPPRRDCR